MGNDKDIRVRISSRAQDCLYRFQLEFRSGCKVDEGTITFNVNSEFTNLQAVDSTSNVGELTFDGQVGTWDLTDVNRRVGRTIFTAVYTGSTTGERVVISDIEYNLDGESEVVADDYSVNVLEVCQSDITDCCEECPTSGNYVEAIVEGCTDNTRIELTEDNINLESTGRVLAVDISLPAVCDSKDVNIGIFVNEVLLDEDENEFEQPFAYKVLRFSAADDPEGTCLEGRGCSCVEFMIDDDTPQCETRTFRVRTKAHYVSTTNPRCDCDCEE